MKIKLLFYCVLATFLPLSVSQAGCHGAFPNPITDICWKCIFPLKIGGVTINPGDMEDVGDNAPAICACPIAVPPFIKIGVGTGFWEPARAAEVSKEPFCSPLLGGTKIGSLSFVKSGDGRTDSEESKYAFYHVHWLIYPLTSWTSILTDTACQVPESYDVLMMSEFEPTWNDDELATIFSPEATLFANPTAQAVCAADCVASSIGYPLDPLFWCAGCNGSLYPLSGNIVGHQSDLDSSLLVVQRMHTKMHRALIARDMGSKASMCLPIPLPIIAKSRYKTQMVYPVPVTNKSQPYGRTTALWGAGKQFPIKGEDFAYIIWRRRVCCAF